LEAIQNTVFSKRIRVSENFSDFDKLRSYSIRREDFIRGLFSIGYYLDEEETNVLAEKYADPAKKGFCKWKSFCDDVDRVFGENDLERKPTAEPTKEAERSPFANTGEPLDSHEEQIFQAVIEKIRKHLHVRKTSIKPFFRDCDKICSGIGHVTKSQLRQCLTFMDCFVTDEEFSVICKKYSKRTPETSTGFNYINDVGKNICYIHFINEIEKGLDQEEDHTPIQEQAKLRKKKLNKPLAPTYLSPHSAFEQLMMKIKIKSKTERIRVIDFMRDFDHPRTGKISKNEFRRALKVVFPYLTEDDLQILETKYEEQDGSINYGDFSDAVEDVFTKKGLEQNPTEKIIKFDVYSNGYARKILLIFLDGKPTHSSTIWIQKMKRS
jgi:Ca2+-binding EF-hand superfamily protein